MEDTNKEEYREKYDNFMKNTDRLIQQYREQIREKLEETSRMLTILALMAGPEYQDRIFEIDYAAFQLWESLANLQFIKNDGLTLSDLMNMLGGV